MTEFNSFTMTVRLDNLSATFMTASSFDCANYRYDNMSFFFLVIFTFLMSMSKISSGISNINLRSPHCNSRYQRAVIIMRHYHTKDEDDLIKQIESDDELSKEFEDAELVNGHVVSVRAATPEAMAPRYTRR